MIVCEIVRSRRTYANTFHSTVIRILITITLLNTNIRSCVMERRDLNWTDSRTCHRNGLCLVSYGAVQCSNTGTSDIISIFSISTVKLAYICVWICEKWGNWRASSHTFPGSVITPKKSIVVAQGSTITGLIVSIVTFRTLPGAGFVNSFRE